MADRIHKGNRSLKYPILKNIDYASIVRNGKSVLEIEGKELEDKTWREFQLFLGEHLTPGKCYFTIKFKNKSEIFSGMTKAVTMNKSIPEDDTKINQVLDQFKKLESKINNASQAGGVSFDMLMASTKQGYEAQATYLKEKITDKDQIIQELKREITELEDDLNDCEKESAKHSGIGQYLAIGEKILSMKFGSPAKVSLKESNSSDIPEQILLVLGVIDWTKIDQTSIERIATGIQQYISVIPKEFFKGQ